MVKEIEEVREKNGRGRSGWEGKRGNRVQIECTALPRVEFLSNPRRIHSEEEDEEKEEQGLPRALICCSPTPPPFPPHTARMLHCLGLRYQDIPPPLS